MTQTDWIELNPHFTDNFLNSESSESDAIFLRHFYKNALEGSESDLKELLEKVHEIGVKDGQKVGEEC